MDRSGPVSIARRERGRSGSRGGASVATAFAFGCMMHASAARGASPCDDTRPGTGAPIRVPIFGPADFATAQETCARTRISLEGRAALLVAEDDFYGSLLAGLAVRATLALPHGTWVSAWFPGLESRYVANATVDRDVPSLGAGALGFHAPVTSSEHFTLVAYGRVLVPTETLFVSARRYGIEHGTSALYVVSPKLSFVGSLAFASTFTAIPGRVTMVNVPSLSSDLVFRPWTAFGLAIGAGLRPLESFDPRVQIRLYPWRNTFISLAGLFPILGRDRTNAALSLTIGWEGI